MKLEFTPASDDLFRLRHAEQRRRQRRPLAIVVVAAPVLAAAGGAAMAVAGYPVWWGLTVFGLALSGLTVLALRRQAITRLEVEREFAARPWLREPFRFEADDAGITYAHGPYRARAGWPAFKELLETEDHLVLSEKPGPGALFYGLPKHELDRAGGVAAWRTHLATRLKQSGGSVKVRAA